MKLGPMIHRYRPQCVVRVDDYRLLFGTLEQKAAVRQQIERRSRAAKAGWARRRSAQGTEAQRATTEGVVHDGPVAEGHAPKGES
jgi:5-methylcytosine-specific restriction endonuclease McrA